jgi:hypothetical protein
VSIYACSITKSTTWRGSYEEFSNVYHYNMGAFNAAGGSWQSWAEGLANAERPIFDNAVAFKSYRWWGPIGDPATSVTQALGDLTGFGSMISGYETYKELAVVLAWPLARSAATGRKRFLRKYLHTCDIGVASASAGTQGGPLGLDFKNQVIAYANVVDDMSWSVGGTICAPQGDGPTGAPYVLPYAHIRQFRR